MEDISKENKIFIIQKYLNKNNNKYYTILSNIIKTYNLEHSTNMNGIFLNLTILDEDILDDIYFRFTNSENIVFEVIQVEKKQADIVNKKNIKFEKDKLTLDKFDKFLLLKSRSYISI
uniref:Uncharacterized protein n=1 Tax=viral metagenome TaxID=1070528 RepID=A0A6C0CES1_9ZZZZ